MASANALCAFALERQLKPHTYAMGIPDVAAGTLGSPACDAHRFGCRCSIKILDHLDPLVSVVLAKRKQLHWSQAKLAQAAGISRRALLMIEKGGDCNLSTLRRLHACLDIVMQVTSAQAPTLDDMNIQNAKDRFGGTR